MLAIIAPVVAPAVTPAIAPVVAGIINLLLAYLVFRRDRRSPVHRSFALMLLSTAVWALATAFMTGSQNPVLADFWAKVASMTYPINILFFLAFAAAVSRLDLKKWVMAMMLGAAVCLMGLIVATTLFWQGVEIRGFGYGPVANPLLPAYAYYIYALAGLGGVMLFRTWRTDPSPHKRNQVAYILLGFAMIFLGGPEPDVPVLGIPNYARSVAGTTLFAILSTWVILQQRLPEVGSLVRKVLTFLLLAVLAGLAFFFAHLLLPLPAVSAPEMFYDILLFSIILAMFFFLPLKDWAQAVVERPFFRGRYPQLQQLSHLIRETGDLEKMGAMPSSLVALIAGTMQASAARLFIFSPAEESFSCLAAHPAGMDPPLWTMAGDNPLTAFLKRQQRAFAVSEVPPDTAAALGAIGCTETSLVLPLQVDGILTGFLTLGRRTPGGPYSQGDLQLLDQIGPQLALGLRNLQLHRAEQGRISDLAALRESISLIGSGLERKLVLDRAVTEGARLLAVPAAAFWELEGQGDDLYFVVRSAAGLSAAYVQSQRVPLRRVLPEGIEAVTALPLPLFVRFSISDPAVGDHQLNLVEGLTRAMGVPIMSQDRLIGALSFFHKSPERLFTARDIEIARNLASHVAIALENARLYDLEKAERQELEQMEGQRQLFLAAISHELRTPVTSMKLVTDLLAEEIGDTEIPAHKKMVENLQRSLGNLYHRVEDLVAFARLQNTVVAIELEPVPLPEVIRSAAEMCQPFFAAKRQSLKISLPESLPLVRGDSSRLEQVVTNLLWNASKFTPEGSETVVRAFAVEQSSSLSSQGQAIKQSGSRTVGEGYLATQATQATQRTPHAFVQVEIEDHGGPGIPVEDQALVFRPFYTGGPGRGLGLGLAIVQRLVELQGGAIRVASQPGQTTFSFTIPVAD